MRYLWAEAMCCGELATGAVVTPRDVRSAETTLDHLLADGLQVPALWRHPMPPLRFGELPPKRDQFGRVTDFALDDGALWVLLAIPRADDLNRLLGMGHLSPSIYRRPKWRGQRVPGLAIGHVAATANPRQLEQRAIDIGFVSDEPTARPNSSITDTDED